MLKKQDKELHDRDVSGDQKLRFHVPVYMSNV